MRRSKARAGANVVEQTGEQATLLPLSDKHKAELRARAEALAAEYSAPLPDGDAGLIEADRRMRELIPRAREFYAQFQIDAQLEKEVINGITDPVWRGMMTFLEETPPTGLAGAAVKLRLMLDSDLGILDCIEDCGGERAADCLRQVADFIERAALDGASLSAESGL